jgi:hypothetical protein
MVHGHAHKRLPLDSVLSQINPELHPSPYTIRAIEPIKVIWMRHVEAHTGYWWRHLKEGDNLEDLGVGGKGKNVKDTG